MELGLAQKIVIVIFNMFLLEYSYYYSGHINIIIIIIINFVIVAFQSHEVKMLLRACVLKKQQTTISRCVVIPSILDVRLVDAPAGVTQKEGYTGFFHLPSAVLALFFIARRIQRSLSLVDCEVEFFVYPRINRSPLVGHFLFIFIYFL